MFRTSSLVTITHRTSTEWSKYFLRWVTDRYQFHHLTGWFFGQYFHDGVVLFRKGQVPKHIFPHPLSFKITRQIKGIFIKDLLGNRINFDADSGLSSSPCGSKFFFLCHNTEIFPILFYKTHLRPYIQKIVFTTSENSDSRHCWRSGSATLLESG